MSLACISERPEEAITCTDFRLLSLWHQVDQSDLCFFIVKHCVVPNTVSNSHLALHRLPVSCT